MRSLGGAVIVLAGAIILSDRTGNTRGDFDAVLLNSLAVVLIVVGVAGWAFFHRDEPGR